MDIKKYFDELSKMSGSRKNQIINMVNAQIPKEEADLKTPVEEMFFDRMVEEAERDYRKYGKRTIFENVEYESEDPVLDIYSD